MNYQAIAGYKFVDIAAECLADLRRELLRQAMSDHIKGTILLSTEGINLSLGGLRDDIANFQKFLTRYAQLSDLTYRTGEAEKIPFKRLRVRIKKEIIGMGDAAIVPQQHTAPHLSPKVLKQWYDENKDMVILDTRNDYEIDIGTFENAIHLDIETFRQFPNKVLELKEQIKNKPVVTFCTGGIRCEKAAEFMSQHGFDDVYQLDGGILNYFAKCGGEHYEGECFVFDERVAVDSELNETDTCLCFACGNPIKVEQQTTDMICPHCHRSRLGRRQQAA